MNNIIYGSVWFLTEFLKLYLVSFYLFGFEKSERIKEWIVILVGFCLIVSENLIFHTAIERLIGLIILYVFTVNILLLKNKKQSLFVITIYVLICTVDSIIGTLLITALNSSFNANVVVDLIINAIPLLFYGFISLYFYKKRNFIKGKDYSHLKSGVYLVFLGAIFISLMYEPIQKFGLMERNDRTKVTAIVAATLGGLLFLIISTLYLRNTDKKETYKKQNEIYKEMFNQQKKYYEAMLEKEDETRAFRHDIINHVSCLMGLLNNGQYDDAIKYTKDMAGKAESLRPKNVTGNKVIYIVINDIFHNEEEVELKWKGFLPNKLAMDDIDVCILFSNLFKNSVGAARESKDEKCVYVEARTLNGSVFLQIKNPYLGNVKFKKGRPVTTKKEKHLHGFGIRNVEEVVNKYNGIISYAAEDKFLVEIVLEDVILN